MQKQKTNNHWGKRDRESLNIHRTLELDKVFEPMLSDMDTEEIEDEEGDLIRASWLQER